MMRLTNKTVLITGGTRGIGKAMTYQFAAEGARIALLVRRDVDEFVQELQSLGYSVIAIRTDITDYDQVNQAINTVIEKFGTIDILVNNAATIARGNVLEMTMEQWKEVMDVNLNAAFYCCKAIIPHFIENGKGNIINMSSVAAKCGDITAAPVYGTSKGALTTLTRSLARQLACHAIRVNAIAPHAIVTEMSGQWSEDKRKQVVSSIPMGRMGSVDEVAMTALFLATDEAPFITGETININGGYLMD
ncbi:SDR family NAD(P)-dependent oxidoreductase [uncultured Sphaerochaeta sp.]|uniref:SDR family NAD(P)-dependent oxidoreductase n=1 Tax=uncultured Sphaerochaeta sp. TaxID=886478 RepID=UPI0029C9F72D|nr:SDR family NAD(P)-dependent oxidoreductase [uncultured Sphaerochaeta sp.]